MFRILAYLVFSMSLCLGATYSSSGEDGIHQAFEELDQVIKQHNDEVLEKYKSEIEPLIKQKDSYNHQFLMEQEKKLLGIESDVGGTTK